MNCTCNHPGCPSHADNIRQTLLAELRKVLPDAEPFGSSFGLLMYRSPSTGIQALAWHDSETPWVFSLSSERRALPGDALGELRAIAAIAAAPPKVNP